MSEDGTHSISYLLDSNTPPKPVEIPVVEALILDLVDKISELRRLEVDLERHRAILSPIRRIPREVLGHVFTFLHPYEREEKVRNAVGRKGLLQLSRVCKLWRDAALVTHELWAGLQIQPRHTLESLKSVETWLSQAGSLPRRMQYQGWNLRDGEASTNLSRQSCSCGNPNAWPRREPGQCLLATSVMPQLLTNGPRLDHLTLMCSSTVCLGKFLDAMDALRQKNTAAGPRPWDTLRSLSIKFRSTHLQMEGQVGPTFVGHLERLPIVESLEVHIPSPFEDSDFDTSHLELNILPNRIERLTTLYMCCPWRGPQLLKLLPHCCNLETLTINFGNCGSPLWNMDDHPLVQHYTASPIVLPKLRTLRTRMGRNLDLLYLLKAPQLVNFDIGMFRIAKVSEDALLLPVANFLDQSGSTRNISTFQLRACHIDAEGLFSIISNLTALTNLTLDDVKVEMDSLWNMFKGHDHAAAHGGNELSFSNLEKLEILKLPPGYQLDPIVDYIKERGPSLKFQLVASYNIPEQRVMKEEDIRQTLRFTRSGVQTSVIPYVKNLYYL